MGSNYNDYYNALDQEHRGKIECQVARHIKVIEKTEKEILVTIVHQLGEFAPAEIRLFGSFGTDNFREGYSGSIVKTNSMGHLNEPYYTS